MFKIKLLDIIIKPQGYIIKYRILKILNSIALYDNSHLPLATWEPWGPSWDGPQEVCKNI